MTSVPPIPLSITRCFDHADWAAMHSWPYSFAGGHPGFGPSRGENGLTGYDCSGWVSAILNGGHILGHSQALGTHELAEWGLPGRGFFMTVWVRNSGGIEHCFVEFEIPGHPHKRWSVAPHDGLLCGWKDGVSLVGYHPRRRP